MTTFRLPDLGEGIESGDVVDVLVQEGQQITADQDVIEIETDKAVMPVPCPIAGRVASIQVNKGDSVQVGAVVLSIEESAAATNGNAPAAKSKTLPWPLIPVLLTVKS